MIAASNSSTVVALIPVAPGAAIETCFDSEEELNKTQISVGMTVAVIQSDVIARIGKGAKITTGDLTLTATGSAASTVQAGAAAEATGLAVGASILVNVATPWPLWAERSQQKRSPCRQRTA